MARYAKDNRPHLKPVEKIQLSGENTLLRAVVAALFLLIGAGALAYAFSRRTIEAGSSDGPSCAQEFTLLYELGAGEQNTTSENRALVQMYTRACRTAYQMFNAYEGADGMVNLWEIGQHPNETLQVDAALYHRLELIQFYGDRTTANWPISTPA